MRKPFDPQRRLDCPPVTEVHLNFNCRNETVPILRALQHIYSRPEVRGPILQAIARDVNGKSKANRGRPGLSYWEIMVLAAVRLGCSYDYDQLADLAENHRALRQVMGITQPARIMNKSCQGWRMKLIVGPVVERKTFTMLPETPTVKSSIGRKADFSHVTN